MSNNHLYRILKFEKLITLQKKSQFYQKFVTDVGIASRVVFTHSQLQNIVTFQQELVQRLILFTSPQQ